MAKKKMVAKKATTKAVVAKSTDKTLQIVGLILNILILPGLGTIIGGGEKYRTTGIIQLVVAIVSIPLMLVLIGIPIFLGMWIWALITGIKMVQNA